MSYQYPNSGRLPHYEKATGGQLRQAEQPSVLMMSHSPQGQSNYDVGSGQQSIPHILDQANPIDQAEQPILEGEANNPPVARQIQVDLASSTEQLNLRVEEQRRSMNRFTPCQQFVSALAMLLSTIVAVGIFMMLTLFMGVSINRDYFNESGTIAKYIIVAVGLGPIVMRAFFIPCLGCCMSLNRTEKLNLWLNLFFPHLKFHIFRLNPEFKGKLNFFYKQEVIMAVSELVVAVSAAVCFNNSYMNGPGTHYSDTILLLLMIFTFIDVVVCYPLFLCVHGRWLKYKCSQERNQGALADPLLREPNMNQAGPEVQNPGIQNPGF